MFPWCWIDWCRNKKRICDTCVAQNCKICCRNVEMCNNAELSWQLMITFQITWLSEQVMIAFFSRWNIFLCLWNASHFWSNRFKIPSISINHFGGQSIFDFRLSATVQISKIASIILKRFISDEVMICKNRNWHKELFFTKTLLHFKQTKKEGSEWATTEDSK